MSLKMKLTSTISAFLLILGLLIMGVFAAPSASVNLGGTITFTATDVYAKITGTITGTAAEEQPVLEEILIDSKVEAEEINTWSNKNLTFKNDGSMITITIVIENLATDRALYASVIDTVGIVENVTKTISEGAEYIEIPKSVGAGTSTATVILTMKVTDANTSIPNGSTWGYNIDLRDITALDESYYNTLEFSPADDIGNLLSTASTELPKLQVKAANYENMPKDSVLIIPSYVMYKGELCQVTQISPGAFCDLEKGMTDEELPEDSLTDLDKAVEVISKYSIPAKKIVLPKNLEVIGSYAFCGAANLKELTLPESLFLLGEGAFAFTGITEITISGIKNLYNGVFVGCPSLETVNVENCNSTLITEMEFYGCPNLKNMNIGHFSWIPGENDPLTAEDIAVWASFIQSNTTIENYTLNSGVFSIGEDLYSLDSIFLLNSTIKSVKLGDGFTKIDPAAFLGCAGLTSITIPNSVTSIGSGAFQGCAGLTSITIPNSVTSIGTTAFYRCTGLTSITIPSSVTSIGDSAFYECYRLTSITIPNSVTSIGDGAFTGCTGLTSITIPDGVTSIGGSAFNGCDGLTSITIPNSVTSIGNWAFDGCSNLTTVTIDSETISTSLTSLSASGCLIDYATTVYVKEGFEVGSYLLDTTKFTVGSSDKAGYVMYNKVVS